MTANTNTIARLLKSSEIDFDTLHESYDPMLGLVEELIGVVPNCDKLLEIWSPGFRTYNLIVPNFLNLPFSLWGFGAPKKLMGLAMYASSRAAQCYYCSAHTCAFALRRGVSPVSLIDTQDPEEIAVVEVARALAQIPCSLSVQQCETLLNYLSPEDIEWIVLSVGMMGFLNKFMDAVGVELETKTRSEVQIFLNAKDWKSSINASVPSIDNLQTYLRVLKLAPSAISLEKAWTKGVPNCYREAGVFLEQHTGYAFPLLGKLTHKRAIRALTTILRDNLDPQKSELGIANKCLAGLIYASIVGNFPLIKQAYSLIAHFAPAIDRKLLATVVEFAHQPDLEDTADLEFAYSKIERAYTKLSLLPMFSEQTLAVLFLAKAASSSPAKINPHIITRIDGCLSPASIIELMIWLSIQQLMHRLHCFYDVISQI
ncbi:MAG: hypothetical protein AAF383_02370 [Cyanobacteria bacterium P01_A01_bin.83]